MKVYNFKYEKIDEPGDGFFIIQAETQEEAIRLAAMINPNATLVAGV